MLDFMIVIIASLAFITVSVAVIGWVDTYQSAKIRSKRNHPTYKEK